MSALWPCFAVVRGRVREPSEEGLVAPPPVLLQEVQTVMINPEMSSLTVLLPWR